MHDINTDAPRPPAAPGACLEAATLPPAGEGRLFRRSRPVRLADADPGGRLRLDALARHLQDVATDDSIDAYPDGGGVTWVVRRAAVVVGRWPRYLDAVEYTTFCSGAGPRWAERRTWGQAQAGARVDAVAVWACLDLATGRPAPLPREFGSVWGGTTGGRTVSARLAHHGPPAGLAQRPWQVRAADLDVLGHVNNAVHWAAVEDELARLLPGRVPVAAECEYRTPIGPEAEVALCSAVTDGVLRTWLTGPGGVHASAVVRTAAPD